MTVARFTETCSFIPVHLLIIHLQHNKATFAGLPCTHPRVKHAGPSERPCLSQGQLPWLGRTCSGYSCTPCAAMAGCKRLHLLALSLSAVHCVSQAAAGIASVTKATGISEVQYATLAQNFNQTSLNTSSTASTGSITSDSSSSGSSTSGTSSSAVPTYSNAVLTRPVQFSSSVILFDIGDISSTVRQNGRAANW